MSAERLARLRQLFDAAIDLPEDDRPAWLDVHCADDPDLRAEVQTMLDLESGRAEKTGGALFAQALNVLQDVDRSSLIGRRIGRYELVEELGAGGMGRVFKACRRDEGIEQWVALKLMRDELSTRSLMQRFATERRILARLNHPGIAHFIDADTDPSGVSYVVMELVEGLPLFEHVARYSLALPERLGLFRQLLAAVSYAHRNLVIHRDIKASNVLVTDTGIVKLLDFGIAKPLDQNVERTQTHERVFTPISAAPEQLRGDPSDATTDVYALGILLYELVCGRAPFDLAGLSAGQVERLILSVPPSLMHERVPQARGRTPRFPADLEQIVAKALRKEQGLRYSSVESLDQDIGRFLANEPVSVSGSSQWYRVRKFVARHAWSTVFAGLAALVLVTGLGITLWQNAQVRAERDRANASLDVLREAFRGADPTGRTEGQVSARQVLDRSAEVIGPLAEKQPELYADLAGTIAEVQMSIGLWQEGGALLDSAAEVMEQAGESESLRLTLLRARAAIERDDATSAEKMLRDAAQQDGHELAEYWLVASRVATRRKQWQTALDAATQALARLVEPDAQWVLAESLAARAELMLALPDALQARNRAIARLDRALRTLSVSSDAPKNLAAVLSLRRLELLLKLDDQAFSLRELDDLAGAFHEQFGSDSALLGDALGLIADHEVKRSQYADAARHFGLAADIYEKAFGAEHPLAYRTRFNATQLAYRAGDREVARQQFIGLVTRLRGMAMVDGQQRAFFHLEAAKALARPGQTNLSKDALSALADPMHGFDVRSIIDENRKEFATWLAFSYWKSDCAKGAGTDWSIAAVCGSEPGNDPVCRSARDRACLLAAPQQNARSPNDMRL